MMVLHYVSYAAALAAFLFVTLSLASGLLYIAEIIEERSQSAKRIGKQAIYTIIGAHVLFFVFDRLPLQQTLLGIFCHVVYLLNFSRSWPFISLTSPVFIASCALVVADHFAWFHYFAQRAEGPRHGYGRHNQPYRPAWDDTRHYNSGYGDDLSFMDVATFFGICVWFIPFFLFLSLSASDNVLPHLGDSTPVGTPLGTPNPGATPHLGHKHSRSISEPNLKLRAGATLGGGGSILRQVLEGVLSMLPRVRRLRVGGRTSRRPNEGLIASPSISHPPSPSAGPQNWGSPQISSYFPSAVPPSPARSDFSPPASPQTFASAGFTPGHARNYSSSLSRPSSNSNLRGRQTPVKPPTPKRSFTASSAAPILHPMSLSTDNLPGMASAGAPLSAGAVPGARKLAFDEPQQQQPENPSTFSLGPSVISEPAGGGSDLGLNLSAARPPPSQS